MNGARSSIGYRHPGFSWDENNGVRTCHGSLVADRNGRTPFLHDDHFFGVAVLVEWNHRASLQELRPHVEVFGVAVLLVDLDDELRYGTRMGRASRAAQSVLPVIFLENQGYGVRCPMRACRL